MGSIAVCWNFDSASLVTRSAILCSRVCVRLCVWSSALVIGIERTVFLALFDRMSVPEDAGVHTRLISYPGKGNSRSGMDGEEKRKYIHRG